MQNSRLVLSDGAVWTLTEWEQQQELNARYPDMMKMIHAENSRTSKSTRK